MFKTWDAVRLLRFITEKMNSDLWWNAEAEVGTSVKESNRHTPAQLATLNAYYKFGMVGVGKN